MVIHLNHWSIYFLTFSYTWKVICFYLEFYLLIHLWKPLSCMKKVEFFCKSTLTIDPNIDCWFHLYIFLKKEMQDFFSIKQASFSFVATKGCPLLLRDTKILPAFVKMWHKVQRSYGPLSEFNIWCLKKQKLDADFVFANRQPITGSRYGSCMITWLNLWIIFWNPWRVRLDRRSGLFLFIPILLASILVVLGWRTHL